MLLNEPCDTRADLYSLGVIIWEVVTHETPVRGGMRKINVPAEAPEEVHTLLSSSYPVMLSDFPKNPSNITPTGGSLHE